MTDTALVPALTLGPAATPESTVLERLMATIEGKGDLALYEAFMLLAPLRMTNNVRANLLNESKIPPDVGQSWTPHRVVTAARELRVRLAPYSETLYMSYVGRKKRDEALLGLIVEEIREGKLSTGAIRRGLQEKWGGSLEGVDSADEGDFIVPSTTVIGRVIQMCANDSASNRSKIKDAFNQGSQILNPIAIRSPGYPWLVSAIAKKNQSQPQTT